MNISTLNFHNGQHDTPITAKEYLEIIEYFNRHLVIGAELERQVPMDRSRLAIHLKCGSGSNRNRNLKSSPTNKYNIAYIDGDETVGDGYGNELIFAGTCEPFAWIHHKLKLVEDELDRLGAQPYADSCSNHISVLTVQDKVLPSVILKNIWNLSRAFSSALYWITSGDKRYIFRPEGANHYAKPRLQHSPANQSFADFMMNAGDKYSLCNIGKNLSLGRGINRPLQIAGLFVEYRQPDGFRVPSALTALFFLKRALIYKAVDLSRKGTVLVESLDDWENNKLQTNKIRTNEIEGGLDTNFLKAQANRLLDLLEPELKQMSPEALRILRILADTPIGLMAKDEDSQNWHKAIEKKLYKRKYAKLSEREEKVITELLDGRITATSATKWKKKLSTRLRIPVRTVEYILMNIDAKSGLRAVFDKEQKGYTLVKR